MQERGGGRLRVGGDLVLVQSEHVIGGALAAARRGKQAPLRPLFRAVRDRRDRWRNARPGGLSRVWISRSWGGQDPLGTLPCDGRDGIKFAEAS
jgi:hypothetical protein